MDFDFSPKVQQLREQLLDFMDENVYPNEQRFLEEVAKNRSEKNNPLPELGYL